MKASPHIQEYFDKIGKGIQEAYEVARAARKKGLDPESDVSIPLTKNMAERVVGLISVVAPQVTDSKVTERITELEKEYGLLDWRVGFRIAEEVAQEKHCKFKDKLEAMEVGIRVGFAYLTLGIVSAPLEGFIGLKIKKRRDGKEYFALQYAGPIRGAGGTAASTSVILADYVRIKMGYHPYDPDEKEINRFIIEIQDYHERVTNLQYRPSDEEVKFMASHLPVEVDGDPTEEIEVSNYKDIPRIETNFIRGGMALVMAEGLCQKAPKLWKRLSKWGKDFGLDWEFMNEFLQLKEKIHAQHAAAKEKEKTTETKKVVKANNTFIMDMVAGRPILTHPLGIGGLRLRYGRTRVSGFSAAGMHPATLMVLEKYIAIGTQLKVERPGKGATVTICDTIEGPIVRLKDGSVLKLKTEEAARQHNPNIEEIVFLGDIMFNYGDFSESGHYLAPAGYCPEWWVQEVEKSIQEKYEGKNSAAAKEIVIEEERLQKILSSPLFEFPTIEEAVAISSILKVPLHPEYTFYWKLVSPADVVLLLQWLKQGKIKKDEKEIKKIIAPYYQNQELHKKGKKILEFLGVPHSVVNKENIVLEREEAMVLALCFNIDDQASLEKVECSISQEKDGLELVNRISSIKLRDKAGTFIGARMGRPEKAKMRHLTGSPQVLFPVGEEGDRFRSFQSALEAGKVQSTFPTFFCTPCNKEMVYRSCEECGKGCVQRYNCNYCGLLEKDTCRHGKTFPYKKADIDIQYYFTKAKERLGEKLHADLIKGVRGTSNKNHVVEHLAKGILRAKHDVYVNKEGTTRYDCTELPITHFKPKEIGTSVEKLRELGYPKDIHGQELSDDNQILELKPQDIILPGFDSLDESAPKVLKRVSQFVDDLLVQFYGLKPFYNLQKEEDLTGHLVIALAPHISAGLVGRIIGSSQTQGLLAHPTFHAGLRRDCDGDEAAVMLLMDALLNFSRQFLPNTRGSTMDAPLVLTSFLDPTEVDDQVHGVDVVWRYPLELYEASLELKNPWEVKYGPEKKKVEQLSDRLGTERQYEGYGFTHHVDNFNKGIQCSAYKILPSMEEKLFGQMEIAKKVRAVDMDDVAKLVIQKHFLRDIKGNLRKFSMQQFRCVKCNAKFRRPPLINKCTACGGRLIFTISEGSVVKYLIPSLKLAEKYDFSPYLKQTLDMVKEQVDMIFGKEKDKQVGLGSFMG
ncbi:MAG: DNA polymerase II large subunit [Nanoarchaeota archaeon]|nr:DNA polymerase II large subunit [Nanoarchaeota archaeon]